MAYKGSGWYLVMPDSHVIYIDSKDSYNDYREEYAEDMELNIDDVKLIYQNDVTEPEFFITVTECELEDTNRHDFVDVPRNLFNDINKGLNLNKQAKLHIAKMIYKNLTGI